MKGAKPRSPHSPWEDQQRGIQTREILPREWLKFVRAEPRRPGMSTRRAWRLHACPLSRSTQTQVTATVPSGAKTGPVAIQTQGGIAISTRVHGDAVIKTRLVN